jgi:glutaredoxin
VKIKKGDKIMVILYTTHCPKCVVLEKKLKSKNIEYIENTDTDLMISKGFETTPMLEIDGEIMNFVAANTWINAQ